MRRDFCLCHLRVKKQLSSGLFVSQFPPRKGAGFSKELLGVGGLVCCSGANDLRSQSEFFTHT